VAGSNRCQRCELTNPAWLPICTNCGQPFFQGPVPLAVAPTGSQLTVVEQLNLLAEEYTTTLTSIHHHEQTMWQLLSIYFAVAGAIITFWVSSEQPRSPEAIFVM